jgi:5-methylcytosine-specific restriction endonuclease McrA
MPTGKKCDEPGCGKPHRAKGKCSTHYNRSAGFHDQPRNGNPERKRMLDLARAKRRRAIQRGADAEVIYRAQIGERDHWRCGICGRKVDRRLTYPHPKSPSLDHVVPISQGGQHVAANVRIAHLTCNVNRGAGGGGEQLALLG